MTALSNRGIPGLALVPAWKTPLALTVVLGGWVLFLYGRTALSMVATWERSETFAHGFLVLPIVLWLVWRQRGSLAGEMPAPSRSAAWLLLPVGFAWLLGELAAANALAQFALVGLLAGSVPALLGWRVARRLAFPLGFLAFAVPMGEFLIPQLMDWTARFTVLGLRLSGVPVYQDGLEFVIPSGNWSVVEACSGIRYLISSLMVGTLFAYLNFRSPGRRLAFIAVSAAVPLVANWVRAYGVVMIGHLSGNKLATGVDHLVYGWVFFGVVVGVLFLIGSRWADREAPAADPAGRAEAVTAPRFQDWSGVGLLALVVSLPALAFAGIERLNQAAPPALEKNLDAFAALGWEAVADAGPAWRPAFRDAADVWHQGFAKDGQRVELHIGYYRNQGPDRKLAAPASLLRGNGASWVPGSLYRVELDGDVPAANGAELRPGSAAAGPLVVRQWYWAGGSVTESPHRARALAAWSRLRGRGDDGAAIVLSAPAGGEAALEGFIRSAGPAVTQILNDTRNRR